MDRLPGHMVMEAGGVNPSDVVINEPKPPEEEQSHGLVGLDELAKTDRILVQQLAEYAEAACSCACGYEGENEFEVMMMMMMMMILVMMLLQVTDRFGHQIFLAE